jgi:predicted RNA-binding Zn ribbon-like protein
VPDYPRSLATLDLIGGSAALDFANTINSRRAPVHDYLGSYPDVLAWEAKVGLIDDAGRNRLSGLAAVDRPGSVRALRAAHELRDAIYRTFSARTLGALPEEPHLRLVLRAHAAAIAGGEPELHADGTLGLAWRKPFRLEDAFHPIAHAAGELLLGSPMLKLGECPSCGWLFVDPTRNRSRRWCDMRTCGARSKMRRYYSSHARSASEISPPRN